MEENNVVTEAVQEAPAVADTAAAAPAAGPRDFKRRPRKKVCAFCADPSCVIDYKDSAKLRKFVSERGKILPRRVTATCASHQRKLVVAIKLAREVGLLPYDAD